MKYNITDTVVIQQFIYGGKAVFTVRSLTSGKHWTFKINYKEDGDIYFVKIMAAPQEFYYIGYIKQNIYYASKKGDHTDNLTDTHLVIVYLLKYIKDGRLHPKFEFFHEGKCAACGRPLTDPISIERGFGPHCASLL